MNKKIIVNLIIILILGSVVFWFSFKKTDSNIVVLQVKNYENNIINVLLKETNKIMREVNVLNWKQFDDDVSGVQFKYPANVRVEYDYAENFSDVSDMFIGGGNIKLFFYDEDDNKLGFMEILSISPYTQFIKKTFAKLDAVEINQKIKAKNVWKIDRRKDGRIHQKECESVGYVQGNNDIIFPWTVVDAGHGDVFAMSDIIYYNAEADNLKDLEIRFYGCSKEDQDLLYGILKTLKFN